MPLTCPALSLSPSAVTRLADISLHDPVSISVMDESIGSSSSLDEEDSDDSGSQSEDELDGFVMPQGLEQHVAVVPSKLHLVCLAAFILQKCRVRPSDTVAAPMEC